MIKKLFVLFVAALLCAQASWAHSALKSSMPADGEVVGRADTVTLTFAADVRLIRLRLVSNNLDVPLPVDRTAPAAMTFTAPLPVLADGAFEIEWTAMAADGHVVTGSFDFAVAAHGGMSGHMAGPFKLNSWNVLSTLVKALLYATCLTAAGGAFFLLIFTGQLTPVQRRRAAAFTRAMATLALYLTFARVAVAAASMGGNAASLWDWTLIRLVLEGSEGPAAVVRALGLLAVAAFAPSPRWTAVAAAPGAVLAAGSFALTGHTVSLGPGNWPQFVVALHLVAAAYWVGALVPLLQLTASPDRPRLAAILKRFGNVALVMVGALIAAGLFLIWAMLDLPDGLIGSTYGRLLLIKLGLVAGLLALAALNKLRFTPRIEAGDQAATVSLRRSIRAEIALAALILLITAMFTTLTGPPSLH